MNTHEENALLNRIEAQIKGTRVVLYMKGSPEYPRCGFSKSVVDILEHLGVHYLAIDVLEHPDIREGIKRYGNWPTIPQLYVDGELIGGCDIVLEKYQDGSLLKLISVA